MPVGVIDIEFAPFHAQFLGFGFDAQYPFAHVCRRLAGKELYASSLLGSTSRREANGLATRTARRSAACEGMTPGAKGESLFDRRPQSASTDG